MAVTEHPVYPVLWRDGRGRDRGPLAHPGRRGRTIHRAVGVGVRLMARPSAVLLLRRSVLLRRVCPAVGLFAVCVRVFV